MPKIQIGVTAKRAPDGSFLPSEKIYADNIEQLPGFTQLVRLFSEYYARSKSPNPNMGGGRQ